MSFNAKQALQRIRQSKGSALKADSQSIQQSSAKIPVFQDFPSQFQLNKRQPFHGYGDQSNNFEQLNTSGFGSIQSVQKEDTMLMTQLIKKVQHLQKTTDKLSKQLAHSQQISQLMRKQKSTLQNQILKLQSQNRQLKQQNRRKQSSRPFQRQQTTESKQDSAQKISKGSEQSIRMDANNSINESVNILGKCTMVSQQMLSSIINQPIKKILSKKQQNFRALRVNTRLFHNQNKELSSLARIFKQYPDMQKPTIQIDISHLNQEDMMDY